MARTWSNDLIVKFAYALKLRAYAPQSGNMRQIFRYLQKYTIYAINIQYMQKLCILFILFIYLFILFIF